MVFCLYCPIHPVHPCSMIFRRSISSLLQVSLAPAPYDGADHSRINGRSLMKMNHEWTRINTKFVESFCLFLEILSPLSDPWRIPLKPSPTP